VIFIDWTLIFKENKNEIDKNFVVNFLWSFKRDEVLLVLHSGDVKIIRDCLLKMRIKNSVVSYSSLRDDDFLITLYPDKIKSNGVVVFDYFERFGSHITVSKKYITKDIILKILNKDPVKTCIKNNIVLINDGDHFISPIVKDRLDRLNLLF